MPAYSPLDILRRIDNKLLDKYFKNKELFANLGIGDLPQTKIEPVHEAIQALDPEQKQLIEKDLRAVAALAEKRLIQMLFSTLQKEGHDLPSFRRKRANFDKSMWAFLEHPKIFEEVSFFSFPSFQRRYWQKFPYPESRPAFTKEALKNLEKAIANFFLNHDGRGELCRVEHHSFQGKEYLFAYPADYPDSVPEWLKTGQFECKDHQFAFLIVFVFSVNGTSLDLYVEEPLEVKREIFSIFAKEILNLDDVDTKPKRSFDLTPFHNRDHGLRIPAGCPLKSLVVQRIKFAPRHNPAATYTIEADASKDSYAIYDELQKKYLSISHIKQIGLRAVLQANEADKEKIISFEVSPSSCSLKHEDEAGLLRQFLKDSGVDVTE